VEDEKGKFVTTLLFPNEYPRNLNQVSGLTTSELIYLKRKFVSRTGYELVSLPIAACVGVTHKDGRPTGRIAGGVALASLYGFRMVLGARRHRLVFQMSDGKQLVWASRAGDYRYKEAGVAKVVEFAKSTGILRDA
jgi:hypothetical protein